MRTLLVNIQLNICKVYDMKRNRAGIAGNQLCQINHLLLCTVTGIGRCMEINCINLYAPLGNHIACYRAVDSAGQKKHGFSVRSHRHTAGARNHQGVNIDYLSNLNLQKNLWLMHIYRSFRIGV